MSFDEARNHPDALAQVEAIFSGWGYRQMDASFLDLCPNLKIVFYAGGTIHRPVSYTHLDVYKRQISSILFFSRPCPAWMRAGFFHKTFAISPPGFTKTGD